MIDFIEKANDLDARRNWTPIEKQAVCQFCYDWIFHKDRGVVGINRDYTIRNLLYTTDFFADVFNGWRDDGVKKHYLTKIKNRANEYLEERRLGSFKERSFISWSYKAFREFDELESSAQYLETLDSRALVLYVSAWKDVYNNFVTDVLYTYKLLKIKKDIFPITEI